MSDFSRLSTYDYPFDESLIAHEPAPTREGSRLLRVDRRGASLADDRFRDLALRLRPGDLLVMNDSRVRRSRLLGRRATGAEVEVLVLEIRPDGELRGMMRPMGRLKAGEFIDMPGGARFEFLGRSTEGAGLSPSFSGQIGAGRLWVDGKNTGPADVEAYLETRGQTPLPPYIRDPGVPADRYQTVYARETGSAAAPTAGLHFSPGIFEALKERGVETCTVTLHVGAGTFQPVPCEDLTDHRLHREACEIPDATAEALTTAGREGRRIIAVGTTSLRVLETRYRETGGFPAGSFHTEIFIRPPDTPRSIQGLLTNFHLPKSTLFMLVGAFAGLDLARRAYAHAVAERYRFFSFGDAMLIT